MEFASELVGLLAAIVGLGAAWEANKKTRPIHILWNWELNETGWGDTHVPPLSHGAGALAPDADQAAGRNRAV